LETRDFTYEFLYVNGGAKGGTWTWGLVGRVNGALLWPDALRFYGSEQESVKAPDFRGFRDRDAIG
jgi:hypothetical protein